MSGPILAPGSRAGAELMERALKGRSLWDDALSAIEARLLWSRYGL